MLAAETLSGAVSPARAFHLDHRAYALIGDPGANVIPLAALVVPRADRRNGWGTRLMQALFASVPGQGMVYPADSSRRTRTRVLRAVRLDAYGYKPVGDDTGLVAEIRRVMPMADVSLLIHDLDSAVTPAGRDSSAAGSSENCASTPPPR